jgi:hypothetical protein
LRPEANGATTAGAVRGDFGRLAGLGVDLEQTEARCASRIMRWPSAVSDLLGELRSSFWTSCALSCSDFIALISYCIDCAAISSEGEKS